MIGIAYEYAKWREGKANKGLTCEELSCNLEKNIKDFNRYCGSKITYDDMFDLESDYNYEHNIKFSSKFQYE